MSRNLLATAYRQRTAATPRRRFATIKRTSTLATPLAPITFPATLLGGRIEIALGADPAGDPAGWLWQDITEFVRYSPSVQIVFGRRDESTTVGASTCRLTLDNEGGRFVRRNPTGPYYGLLSKRTPIRIGIDPGDGVHYRFHGFVNEWPTRWSDESGTDSTVPIMCSGMLQLLTTSKGRTLGSALFRAMSGVSQGDFRPAAYLPMEDQSGATQLAAGLAGGASGRISGDVSIAAYAGAAGSSPLPTINTNGRIRWPLSITPTGTWQLQFIMAIPSQPSTTAPYLDIPVSGEGSGVTRIRVIYSLTFTALNIQALDAAGGIVQENGLSFTSGGVPIIEPNVPYLWSITQFDLGGSCETQFTQWRSDGEFAQSAPLLYAGAVGTPLRVAAMASAINAGWSTGHWAIYTDPAILTTPNISPNATAIDGFVGEQAHERIIRLCREERVPLFCTSARSAAMGPQPAGRLLELLRECEAADLGVLYEKEFGLAYQSLDDRFNAPVQFELDFDARHVAGVPEPADDDQRLLNRITVSRSGGSYAVVQDDASIDADGVADGTASPSVATDDQLADVGGWLVRLGTVDVDRWPQIGIHPDATTDVIPAWTALPYGARAGVANPPAEVAPDTLDVIVEGWTETFNTTSWEAVLNTSPASPYQVGITADSSGVPAAAGLMLAGSMQLAATVDSTTTTWTFNASPAWDTSAALYPQTWRCGGEEVTVASVSGASAPQTATLSARSVNGVVKAHDISNPAEVGIEPVNPLIMVP